MLSTDFNTDGQPIASRDRQTLFDVAEASIRSGLGSADRLVIDPTAYPDALRSPQASFVTLRSGAALRGCIGSVRARRPLVADVAENAFHAAFHDSRFPPLRADEFPRLTIHISVLSPLQPLRCTDEADVLRQIRPGLDGLEIEFGTHCGLLLPSVWEQLPDKQQFWQTLKMKAGLPMAAWSQQMNVCRFTTESFAREVNAPPHHRST